MMQLPRYESYKDSGVEWLGEIPEEWDVERNLGIFDERKIVNHPDKELLSVTIEKGVIKQAEITTKKDSSNEDKSKYKLVKPGYLAYNKMRMWQGAVGMSEYEGIVSPAYIILSPRDKAYSRYFHYLLRSDQFMVESNRLSYGLCDDMNSLRYEDFKGIYTPLPPKDTVERIVSFLDQKTVEIDEYTYKKLEILRKFKELQDISVYKYIHDGSIKRMRLEHAASLALRPIVREDEKIYTAIGLYNRGRGLFLKDPQEGKNLGDSLFFWICEDDVVFSGQFAWEGAVALAGKEENGCIASHRYPIVRGNPKIVLNSYLLSFFRTDFGNFLMNEHSHGAAGRNRPLNIRNLLKEKIPVPSIHEQTKFVHMLKQEKELIATVDKEIKTIKEYRAKLISDAVTGKIKV